MKDAAPKAVTVDLRPSSTARIVRVVRPIPREFDPGLPRIVATVESASDQAELELAELVGGEREMARHL